MPRRQPQEEGRDNESAPEPEELPATPLPVDADTGSAAGVGGVAGAAVGSLAGPMGAAIGAVGGMLAGAAAERAMHADDDRQPTPDATDEDDTAHTEEQ